MEELNKRSESAGLTVVNVLLGMAAVTGLYLFPMYLVGHMYTYSLFYFLLAAGSVIVLKFTWYDNLPDADEE